MKNTKKSEIRVRLPQWVIDALEKDALESGIETKPAAAALAYVAEEWVRQREREIKESETA